MNDQDQNQNQDELALAELRRHAQYIERYRLSSDALREAILGGRTVIVHPPSTTGKSLLRLEQAIGRTRR